MAQGIHKTSVFAFVAAALVATSLAALPIDQLYMGTVRGDHYIKVNNLECHIDLGEDDWAMEQLPMNSQRYDHNGIAPHVSMECQELNGIMVYDLVAGRMDHAATVRPLHVQKAFMQHGANTMQMPFCYALIKDYDKVSTCTHAMPVWTHAHMPCRWTHARMRWH